MERTTGTQEMSVRSQTLYSESLRLIHIRTDRLFAALIAFQWVGGVAAALWISPLTWIGTSSEVHLHVWAAVLLGGLIACLPIFLALTRPGETITRHVIAVSQMLASALLIHLTGGRIETHFHIFGSLAFLAFYRDWKVLVSGSAVVAVDHFIRGVYWPQSIFGVLTTSSWRWLEHAAWVVFEDIFLIRSCLQATQEMKETSDRQARLEEANAVIYELLDKVKSTAVRVSTGSEQVSTTAAGISGDAGDQAAVVRQTTGLLKQVANAVIETTGQARDTGMLADEAAQRASAGAEAVEETGSAIQEIATKMRAVEEIAAQTQLLALNAAVEASRFGDQAGGLAVVAAEVRKLAETSQVSAREIRDLTKNGVVVAAHAGTLLQEIVPRIQRTSELVHEIVAAANEQNQRLGELNQTMVVLDERSQNGAASSQQLSSTAKDMYATAEELQKLMSEFNAGTFASAASDQGAR